LAPQARRFGGPIHHPTGRFRYIPLSPLSRYLTFPVAVFLTFFLPLAFLRLVVVIFLFFFRLFYFIHYFHMFILYNIFCSWLVVYVTCVLHSFSSVPFAWKGMTI
jgi:hypothetical protein